MESYTILAVSGSLRAASSNSVLLQVASTLAPAGVTFQLYHGLGDLPHYNPDRDDEIIPNVEALREKVRMADGILICSPEYARGVPGSLKNALDWLVGGIEIVRKPVALINASPYSTHAQAALKIILETMSANVVSDASITVPLRGRKLPPGGMAEDPVIADALRTALVVFTKAIQDARKATS
jgi:chromate reductase, NAD(P)H dehydrogenase (quinone)